MNVRRPLATIGRFRARARTTLRRVTRPKPPVCESMQEWAATRPEADYRVLVPARSQTRELPHTIEPRILPEFLDRQVAHQKEKYLVRVDGARIVGENGLVVLPDGAYASESIYTRELLEGDPDYYAPPRRPVVHKPGSYFSLLVIWSKTGNYYHWLHDSVERLYRAIEWLPADTRFIVPARLAPFQRDSLRFVGIDDDRLEPFSGDEVWSLETLHFSNRTSNSGNHHREADEWLRDRILPGRQVEATPARRILISRRNMKSRATANEEEVEHLLRRFGFETCVPEALSLREQAELFAQAEVVVATHGSALTNLLFAPPGAIVVDMIAPSMSGWAYVFWSMSEALGHRYWYFEIDDVAGAGKGAVAVPLDKLATTIDRLQLDQRIND